MLTGNRLKPTPELEVLDPLVSYLVTLFPDDQPKLRGSGVVVTLVCEYTRDPEGI